MAKGPSNEGIAMPDDAALERELRRIMPSAAEKETEGNWEGRLANFERLTNIVKGSFALPKFIQTIKRVVKEPLSIGLLSDRTRLSRAAMTVVETMGTVLGRNFQALSNDLLKPVLKLTGRTNRIYVNTAVHTIKTCIASGGLPALVEALAESGREPARGQREATADCFAFLMEHNDARSLAPYVDSIEAYIRTAITDASGEVRAYTRSSYETYKCRFPERVDLFHGSLSSVAKKGLKINSSSPLSTKASPARSTKAPPAMKPPVPSTTVSPARPPIRNLVAAAAEHPTKPSFGRVKAEQETASRPRRAVQGPSTETRVGAQRVQRVLRKDDEDTGMNPKKPVGAMRVLARPQTKPELSRVPNSKPALNGRASASRIAKPELKPEINNLRSSVKSYGSKPSLPGTASGISRAAPSPPPLSPPRALPSPPGQLTVPKSPSRLPKPLSPSRLPQPRIVGTVAQPHVHDISLVPSSPETLQNATAPSYSPANGKCLAQPSPKVVSTSTSPSCASQHGKSLVPPSSPKEPCTPSLDALPDVAVGDAPRVASACPPVLQVQGQIPRAASIPGWEAPFVQVDAEHLRVGKNATPDFSADLSFKKINLESIFSPYIVDKPGWPALPVTMMEELRDPSYDGMDLVLDNIAVGAGQEWLPDLIKMTDDAMFSDQPGNTPLFHLRISHIMSCLLDHHFELVMNVTRSLRVIPGTGLFSDIIEYSDDRKDLHMWSSEDMTEFRGTLQYIFEIFEKRNPPGMVWQTSVAALITMPPFAQAYKLLRSTLEMQDAHNRSREELEIMMAYITEGLLGTNKFGIRSAAFECIMTMGQELAPDTFKYLLNMLYENLPKEVPEVRRRRFIDHISNASKEGGGRLRAIMAQKGPASACFRGLWLF